MLSLLLSMNLRQRCQVVFQAGYKVGEQSFRSLAAATKLSKSLEQNSLTCLNGLSLKWESYQHLESPESSLSTQQLVYLLSHLKFYQCS
jgi:hypothetical protein